MKGIGRIFAAAAVVLSIAAVTACTGDRDPVWDAPPPSRQGSMFALSSAVAVIDDPRHRVLLLSSDERLGLTTSSVGIGKNVDTAFVSPDKGRLFVLTRGDAPISRPQDELPSLAVIDDPADGAAPKVVVKSFNDLLSGIAVDPHPNGRWLVLYPRPSQDSAFVENPNELLLIDLQHPEADPAPITLLSTGGYPQRFTFTDPLKMTDGSMRQLLVIETDRDLALLDLEHVGRPPIAVKLPDSASGTPIAPAQVIFDPGDPTSTSETSTGRIGVRLQGSTNMLALRIANPGDAPHVNDFTVTSNLTELGGEATDVRFVHTNHGTRLAALVPSAQKAVLIDTDTSLKVEVPLAGPFQNLSVVTDGVGAQAGGAGQGAAVDVVMLWGGARSSFSGVAFWTTADEAAFRSTENVELAATVEQVLDVSHDHPELKILKTAGSSPFYVLDLRNQTASPIIWGGPIAGDGFELSNDGRRLWVFATGTRELAVVKLDGLATQNVPIQRPVSGAFEIQNRGGTSRSLVVLHTDGAWGATLFDALDPKIATARTYASLLLQGIVQ